MSIMKKEMDDFTVEKTAELESKLRKTKEEVGGIGGALTTTFLLGKPLPRFTGKVFRELGFNQGTGGKIAKILSGKTPIPAGNKAV